MNFTPLFHPHQTLFFYSAAEVFNLLQVGQLPPDMAGIGNKIFYCYCTFIRADICIRFSMEIQIDVKNWPGEKTSELFRPNETYTLYLNIEHTVWSKSLPPAPKKWPIDKEMKISSPINFDKGYEIFGADNSLIFSPIRCPPPKKYKVGTYGTFTGLISTGVPPSMVATPQKIQEHLYDRTLYENRPVLGRTGRRY